MSSGAKKIFSSTLPHSDNCAWEGFFTCSLRVVSVWAHSMQLISFTTKSLQIYFHWHGNIIFAVTCTPESQSHVDNQAELPMTSATDSLSPITCMYINTCMYILCLKLAVKSTSNLWLAFYSNVSNSSWNKSWCVSQAGKPSASPRFLHGLWGSFRRSSLWKFSHNFPAEIQEK